MIKKKEELDREKKNVRERLIPMEVIVEGGKEKIYEQEMGRLEAVTRYLIGLEEEASSFTLKRACGEALGVSECNGHRL